VVDVLVEAIDVRDRERYAPLRREAPVERAHQVPVARLDLVVLGRDLAHRDVVRSPSRLVLVDRFVAQVAAHAGLGPRALYGPVGVDEAEGGAAARAGIARR